MRTWGCDCGGATGSVCAGPRCATRTRFADAVLSVNGIDPRVVPSVRGQVRDHVAEWLLTQPRTD